jgi:hypothetical protein
MNTQLLARPFTAIGAQIEVEIDTPRVRRFGRPLSRLNMVQDFTLDVRQDNKGERFALLVRPNLEEVLEFQALDVQPERRHLLLLAKRLDRSDMDSKQKFLCGHDERHWFVAAVPNARSVTRIEEAMEALKPQAAIRSQKRHGVKAKDWNDRHNKGFLRQGEWFFLPMPDFTPPDPKMILRDEPIRRSGGKPHIVEHLYRFGGDHVYVNDRYPSGLTETNYRALLKLQPEAARWHWIPMRRNPVVYAKGKIRHPDHATLTLPTWHRVAMSEEQRVANVVFLD